MQTEITKCSFLNAISKSMLCKVYEDDARHETCRWKGEQDECFYDTEYCDDDTMKTLYDAFMGAPAEDCHNLSCTEIAERLVKPLFRRERISWDGWDVFEVPMVDLSGKYPISANICIRNRKEKYYVVVNFDQNACWYSFEVDEPGVSILDDKNTRHYSRLTDALNHPWAKYA